jgi:hypothetical protein
MSEGTVTVLMDEEYGYREWIWKTGMTPDQLIEWWTNLPSVMPFFCNPSTGGMPGELAQTIEDTTDLDAEVARIRSDKSLSVEEQDKAIEQAYRSMPYKMVIRDTGEPMPCAKGWWRGHIHMEDDSWLETPEGVTIHHAGYSEEEE